jgi:hypothetical protein
MFAEKFQSPNEHFKTHHLIIIKTGSHKKSCFADETAVAALATQWIRE